MTKKSFVYIFVITIILVSHITILKAKWSDPIVISSESKNSAYRAVLDIDIDDNLHIAWKDNSNYSNAFDDWDIFYKYKPKNKDWTKTEVVTTESINDSNCLFMSVDKNKTVHVVWKDKTDIDDAGSDYDIFYKYKQFNKNWSKMKLVSINSTADSGCPCSTIDNKGNLHVVWADQINIEKSTNDWDVYYSKLNADDNWIYIELVSTESGLNSFEPVIDVDSKNNIHVVWYEKSNYENSGNDYDIFYKYKLADNTWSKKELVSKESTHSSTIPALTIDSEDILHLAWVDATNINNAGSDGDIFYKNKTLEGNFSEIEVVSIESKNYGHWPSITTDMNDTVHIVWKDKIIKNYKRTYSDIFYKYKTKKGVWSELEIVSINSTYESNWGSIVTDLKGRVHVSWWDDLDGKWVMYYSSRNPADINITNKPDIKDNKSESENFLIFIPIAIIAIIAIFVIIVKLRR